MGVVFPVLGTEEGTGYGRSLRGTQKFTSETFICDLLIVTGVREEVKLENQVGLLHN